jgi:DNA mismatch repair protein MutL
MRDIIRLLPDSVANQIAAGEVIQRPASILKELVENSVDAGATEINVVIRDAGRTLVQVEDNGLGMSETDARLSFERHATSKITNALDLFHITTKGFRGEALASIAAVAMVELKTKRDEDEAGVLIEIDGSHIEKQEPCPMHTGSVFSVKNLFYNIPARRKFLKSDNTEFRHIITEFQRVALAHPAIKFSLSHNNEEIYRLQAGNSRLRIASVFGKQYNQNLVEVDTRSSIVNITGYVGKPESARRTPGEQFFFINNRFIRHPYLHRAIIEAFQGILSADAVPSYFLFLTADPATIDVNIHPTKTEVKFEDERSVWQILLASVRESLGRFNVVPSLDFGPESAMEIPVLPSGMQRPSVPEPDIDPTFNPFEEREYTRQKTTWDNPRHDEYSGNWESLYTVTARSGDSQQQESGENITGENRRRFFQVKNRYILCPVISGIMMIDQRRAHERILYEKFLNSLGNGPAPVQVSMFPIETELSPGDLVILLEINDDLLRLGFDVERGKGNHVIIKGHPADSRNPNPLEMLFTLVAEYKMTLNDPSVGARERVAMSMAKASAVAYGMALTQTEMEELFDLLFACSMPGYSPSGRPVMNILTLEELDKRFS